MPIKILQIHFLLNIRTLIAQLTQPIRRDLNRYRAEFSTNLELLDEEDGGSVGLEGVGELEPAIQEADHAVIAPDSDPAPPARAAPDVAADLARDRHLAGGFLLEELELPPLVHVAEIGGAASES